MSKNINVIGFDPELVTVLKPAFAMVTIGARLHNSFKSAGIHSLQDLLKCSSDELMRIPNLGFKSIEIVKACLKEHGFHLQEDKLQLHREPSLFDKKFEVHLLIQSLRMHADNMAATAAALHKLVDNIEDKLKETDV